jgi:hypothetical protein
VKSLLMRVVTVTTLYSPETKEIEGYTINLLSVIDGVPSRAVEVSANLSPQTSEEDLKLLTELGGEFYLQLWPKDADSLEWEVPA